MTGRLTMGLLAAMLAASGVSATDITPETTLVAARSIRARTIIRATDIQPGPVAVRGALGDAADVVGMEARGWLQQGRPIMPDDVVPPAMVERNQVVTMRFLRGALEILAEGRALERAAEGDRVRVMNLDSRVTVTGTVAAPGLVEVR